MKKGTAIAVTAVPLPISGVRHRVSPHSLPLRVRGRGKHLFWTPTDRRQRSASESVSPTRESACAIMADPLSTDEDPVADGDLWVSGDRGRTDDIIRSFFTCRISMHGRCHDLPCLNEFSGVVPGCFTLSRRLVKRKKTQLNGKTRSNQFVKSNCLFKVLGRG